MTLPREIERGLQAFRRRLWGDRFLCTTCCLVYPRAEEARVETCRGCAEGFVCRTCRRALPRAEESGGVVPRVCRDCDRDRYNGRMPEYAPLAGDTVEYRTVPCPTLDEGPDIALYANYPRDGRTRLRPLWRPALVTRVWSDGDPRSALNLRVIADGGAPDQWRASVHREGAGVPAGQRCWRPRVPRVPDERTPTGGLAGA